MEMLLYCISLSVLVFINVTLATGKLSYLSEDKATLTVGKLEFLYT